MGEILQFRKDQNTYIKLANERAEKGDLTGALGFLFCAKSILETPEVLEKIADLYAEMGNPELSNKYWFYYIDKAPKDKVTIAFEELAINYFYLDDFLCSSYYFHEKLIRDGVIAKEGLDPEIIEFFSGEEIKNNAYHIAYPFERADFSYELKKGKRALSAGEFEQAVKVFSAIPKECLGEDGAGDFAVAKLMVDDIDGAIEVARESLTLHGENLTAYCNLSTAFDMKEDFEKSEYYYNKAKACAKGDKNEEYKLATCAIERLDHTVVRNCVEKILSERPYDIAMRFFYGISLLNCGDKSGALEQLSLAYRLNPEDHVLKFYCKYVRELVESPQTAEDYSPIRYLKILPEKVATERSKKIKEIIANPSKIPFYVKKKEIREILEWGVYSEDKDVARECVYVLATAFNAYSKGVLLDVLKNNDVNTSTKRVIVYALIVAGFTDKFSVVDRNFHFRIRAKKLACEKKEGAELYLSAYALCFSRMVFSGETGLDKIAKVTDKIYSKLKDKISASEVSNEELASLILLECGFARFDSESSVMRIFEVSKNKLKLLKSLYKGE